MTIQFQKNLLTFLITHKKAKKLLTDFSYECFELSEHQLVCQLLKNYYKKYHTQPSEDNFIEFLNIIAQKQGIDQDSVQHLTNTIKVLYVDLPDDSGIYVEEAILFMQRKKLKKVLIENLDEIKTGDDKLFNKILDNVEDITNLKKIFEDDVDEVESSTWLLKGHTVEKRTFQQAFPTYLPKLNSFTASGGFCTPELIILMAGPKSFKTGWLINLVVNYVFDGLKVLYVDYENGVQNIRMRSQQCIAGATYKEIMEGEVDEVLIAQMKQIEKFKGEMRIISLKANVDDLTAVERELDRLKAEDDFIPDLIAYDYLDLAACEDKTLREETHKIQYNYHHAIRINNKYKLFSFSPSQVNRQAVNKRVLNMADFSKDFGKAMNCHACFALCRTQEEQDNNIGRITIIAQRMGKKASSENSIPIYIDEGRMILRELTEDELKNSGYDSEAEDD